jgi:hypothetical protein
MKADRRKGKNLLKDGGRQTKGKKLVDRWRQAEEREKKLVDRWSQTEEREKTRRQMETDRRKGKNSWTDIGRQKKGKKLVDR